MGAFTSWLISPKYNGKIEHIFRAEYPYAFLSFFSHHYSFYGIVLEYKPLSSKLINSICFMLFWICNETPISPYIPWELAELRFLPSVWTTFSFTLKHVFFWLLCSVGINICHITWCDTLVSLDKLGQWRHLNLPHPLKLKYLGYLSYNTTCRINV